MNNNKEELEFSLIGGNWYNLGQNYTYSTTKTITDFYFDTPDRFLKSKGWVFRRRNENGNKIEHTLKSGTIVVNDWKIPQRTEFNVGSYKEGIEMLKNLFGPLHNDMGVFQYRKTQRDVYSIKGFDLYIDHVSYEKNVYYTNVELELFDKSQVQQMIEFKDRLVNIWGFREWPYSKTAVGEAVKALGLTNINLGQDEIAKIEEYLSKK